MAWFKSEKIGKWDHEKKYILCEAEKGSNFWEKNEKEGKKTFTRDPCLHEELASEDWLDFSRPKPKWPLSLDDNLAEKVSSLAS